jgi:hypothetical protein
VREGDSWGRWMPLALVPPNRALSDRCVATLADLPSTTASHPDFHDLCSQVRQGAVRLAAVVARRGERHDWSHSGHSRLRRLLHPLEVPRMAMNLIEALPLGILEGVTEFLPVSSTGHLTIAEGLLGLKVDDPVTAFTAIIQVDAILAVIIYFRSDIRRLASAWLRGLVTARPAKRPTTGSLGMSSSA